MEKYYSVDAFGGFSEIESLEKRVEGAPYLLRKLTYEKYGTLYVKLTFIDENGNPQNLRIGDWEVTYIQDFQEYYKPGYQMYFTVFNVITKQFISKIYAEGNGLFLLSKKMFPKLMELQGLRTYKEAQILNKLDELTTLVENINDKLDNVEK